MISRRVVQIPIENPIQTDIKNCQKWLGHERNPRNQHFSYKTPPKQPPKYFQITI